MSDLIWLIILTPIFCQLKNRGVNYEYINILMIRLVLLAPLTAQMSGRGTIEDPWLVSNQLELDNVRNYPDSSFIQVNDIYLTGEWTPIDSFSGTNNGNYYAIYDLTITGHNSNVDLFSTQFGNLVRVRLVNVQVYGNDTVSSLVGANNVLILYSSSYEGDY